jgi:hypothetical protein
MEDVSRPSHGEESQPSQEETFLEKVDAAARSGRNVDRIYGVGEPDAPPVKRKPSWIFGLVLILIGVGVLELDLEATLMHKSLYAAIFAMMLIATGGAELLNWDGKRKRSLRK